MRGECDASSVCSVTRAQPLPLRGPVDRGRHLNNDAATLVQVASRLFLSAHVLML
jgi:hypothetical protein